jgi:hypothetical protein
MANPTADNEIASHFKAKNGYGQNGYQGASSDTPGEHTTSGFLPQTDQAIVAARQGDHQDKIGFRKGSAEPAHAGMKSRTVSDGSPGGIIPKSLDYAKK